MDQENALSLLCPNCSTNLTESGFYNYCSESVFLREDNKTEILDGRVYMDHTEHDHETHDHQCHTDAHCGTCNELLPWPLYELRSLDGNTLEDAIVAIAELLSPTLNDQPASHVPVA